MTNMGVGVYAVDLAAELEEGESAGSVVKFVWIDVESLARHIVERYFLQVVDAEDTTSNLVHYLGCILLVSEFFDGYIAGNEGNGIVDRVQLQEAVDGRCK